MHMPISYLDPNSKKIIREPLVKRFRSFYRSPRKSGQENLFNQKVYMDMNREYVGALATIELVESKSKTEDFNVGSETLPLTVSTKAEV